MNCVVFGMVDEIFIMRRPLSNGVRLFRGGSRIRNIYMQAMLNDFPRF